MKKVRANIDGINVTVMTDDEGNVSVNVEGDKVSVSLNDVELVEKKTKSKSKRKVSKNDNLSIIHDFINKYKYKDDEIIDWGVDIEGKGDMEGCRTITLCGKEYLSTWCKESPDGIYLQNFLPDYKQILIAKNEYGYSLEEIKANFHDDSYYKEAFKKLCDDLGEFNVEFHDIGFDYIDVLNRYFIPVNELNNISEICDILNKYEENFKDEVIIING